MLLENKDLLRFEGYVIDRPAWTLQWQDEPIVLNRKSFDLLIYLIDHRDRVSSKGELLQSLWPDQFVEESNLTQQIFLLRRALSRHESARKIIETIPGRGYRFTAQVEVEQSARPQETIQQQIVLNSRQSVTEITMEEEEIDDGDEPLETSPRPLPRPAKRKGVLAPLAMGGFAAALLVAGGWFGWQRWLDHTGGPPVEVVLSGMDGSTGDTVLDAALVDALRMDLAQSPFVSVVSPDKVRATLSEMMHKPGEALTPPVYREVCERTNSQAVLRGAVARVGQHFLLTEEATSCVNGTVLAEAKKEASTVEDLPKSIDKLAESLRQKLGESRRSIERFDTPLFPVNTKSLVALKDYSQSVHQFEQGKRPEAIALLKQATEADPGFATAYYSLAVNYISGADEIAGRQALQKAYDLRDSASEPIRFAIISFYNSVTTQNLLESELNARTWTELYPRNPTPWSSLFKAAYDLGNPEEQVIAGKQVLELSPTNQSSYVYLAMSQMHAGDTAGARATLDSAIARNLDGDRIRNIYIYLAYLMHDTALLKAQIDWGLAHPQSPFLLSSESAIAMAEGRFRDARKLIEQTADIFRQQGIPGAADNVTQVESINLMETGDIAEGKRLFQSTTPDLEDGYNLIGLIDAGDIAGANAALHAALTKYPHGTLWNFYWKPFLQARIGIVTHHPNGTGALLESARPYERRDLSLRRLRGDAYLAEGQTKSAEKEYRDVLAHPELDPSSGDIPFSWLNLGRALALDGDHKGAIDAYQHFLSIWAHADSDALYLLQAKQELAALKSHAS